MCEEEETVVVVPCEVYSRIVGYIRPIQSWNEAKKQEFEDRTMFEVEEPNDEVRNSR